MIRRRAFIAGLGSGAAWPLVARAQSERVRRIGVLMAVDDADLRASYAAFVEALQQLGWTDGRNVQIETRWVRASPQTGTRSIPSRASRNIASSLHAPSGGAQSHD